MKGRVTISRTSPRDLRIRDLYVRFDDRQEITLLYGQSATFEAEPGEHSVLATNRIFTCREPIVMGPDEEIVLVTGNVGGGCFWPFLALGMPLYRVELERPPT